MESPKDKANDPKRKAEVMNQPVIKNWEWDTRDGSFGPDGKRIDVPSRSWSMPDGK